MSAEYVLQFRGRSRFHMLECWLDSFQAPQTRHMPGCGALNAFADGRDGEWSVYVDTADAARMAAEGLHFVADRSWVTAYGTLTAELGARCQGAARDCAAAASRYGVPDRALAEAFALFFDAYTVLQGHYQATSPLFTAGAERELAEAVSRSGEGEPGSLSVLTYGEPSGLKSLQESVQWLELLLASRRKAWTESERLEALRRHADRFGSIGALSDRLGADPFELCLQRWARDTALSPEDVRTRLTAPRERVTSNLAARQQATERLRLNERSMAIADGLAVLGVKRMAIREEFSLAAYTAYPAFEAVFARLDPDVATADGVRQLSQQEVIRLAAGETVSADTVRDRLRRGVCRVFPGGRISRTGEAAERTVRSYLDGGVSADRGDPDRLSGLVVSGDRSVAGTARVLSRALSRAEQVSEAEAAQPREILVVAMTYPAIAEACTRVAGIVTDFGGLTCHAAVIARGAGVPCIVGTQEATRFLRTGDRVRLDLARSQVVRLPAVGEEG